VRASCPAHGSSLRGGKENPSRTEHPILVSPYGRLSTPVLRSVQLAPSNVSVGWGVQSHRSAETRRKSAPFRAGYPRSRGPVSAITAEPSLSPASSTPSAISFLAVGIPSPRSDGTSGAYPVVQCGEAETASYSPAGPGATVVEGSNRRSHALLAPACQHLVLDYGP